MTVGLDFATGVCFFLAVVVGVYAAYYAMKFTAMHREAREKAEKRQERKQP